MRLVLRLSGRIPLASTLQKSRGGTPPLQQRDRQTVLGFGLHQTAVFAALVVRYSVFRASIAQTIHECSAANDTALTFRCRRFFSVTRPDAFGVGFLIDDAQAGAHVVHEQRARMTISFEW